MKKAKIIALVFILVLLVALTITGCTSGETSNTTEPANDSAPADEFEGVEWTLAHTRSDDSRAAEAAVAFAEAVEEATDGKIKITVYGNGALGDYTTVQERVSLGDVTMQMADFAKTLDTSLVVPTIPYIISTWDEFEKYYHVGTEGAIMADFGTKRIALQNLTLISCYPQYFGSICSATPIEDWEDPSVQKNMKLRVPTEQAYEKLASCFGFQGTGMPASEAYTAIQTGVVDGMLGGGTEYYWYQLGDIINYILPVNTHPVCYWLYINSDALASIPEEYQNLLYELADEYLYQSGLKDAKAEMTMYEDEFKNKGATVYDVTDEILAEYTKQYRENIWPELATVEYLGEEGLDILHQFMDAYGIAH